ncbi:MAG: hypothetical protein GX351_01570 [Peptococcaceae bacterium]|jgi:hypothetical protein|nr:hypothetical protein [Peptococcaceae bacterium]
MISMERLLTTEKESLLELSRNLETEDISHLVEWLTEKDDRLRYNSLLLLEHRSEEYDDVYPYWDIFRVTVRQCIQSLGKIVAYRTDLHNKIANELISIDIMNIRPSMRKLVLIDILHILAIIKKHQPSEKVDTYIFKALTGGLLDKKAVKQIELMLWAI